uniref:Uncharacterized protein n=1 Tax=Nelumbo nucifera TaxID=4432 RepID=A0A822YSQ8_NELNU|nr:TPA_asm: hypothetical protein HUJ06_006160 [Nelumbo nucifera]
MEQTLLSLHSPLLPLQPLSPKLGHWRIKTDVEQYCNDCKRRWSSGSTSRVSAAGRRDATTDGRDWDVIAIFKRMGIHEMKMEWEKQYYAEDDSDICETMERLQTQMMKMRPSLALGVMALVTLSIADSMVATWSAFRERARRILSARDST